MVRESVATALDNEHRFAEECCVAKSSPRPVGCLPTVPPRQGTSLKLLDALRVGGEVRAATRVQGPPENVTHGWGISSASQASRSSETNIWSSRPCC